jgi:hypothetical protein
MFEPIGLLTESLFRCRSELTGVTRTVTRGKGIGKGFLINGDTVTRVGT